MQNSKAFKLLNITTETVSQLVEQSAKINSFVADVQSNLLQRESHAFFTSGIVGHKAHYPHPIEDICNAIEAGVITLEEFMRDYPTLAFVTRTLGAKLFLEQMQEINSNTVIH